MLEELLEQEKLEQQLQKPQQAPQPIQQPLPVQQPSAEGAMQQCQPPSAGPVGYSRNPQGQYVRAQWQGQTRQLPLGPAGVPRMGQPVQPPPLQATEQIQGNFQGDSL